MPFAAFPADSSPLAIDIRKPRITYSNLWWPRRASGISHLFDIAHLHIKRAAKVPPRPGHFPAPIFPSPTTMYVYT